MRHGPYPWGTPPLLLELIWRLWPARAPRIDRERAGEKRECLELRGLGGGGGGGQVPLRAQKKASLTTVASTRGKDKGLAFRKYIDVLTIHLPFLPIFLFSPSSSSFSPLLPCGQLMVWWKPHYESIFMKTSLEPIKRGIPWRISAMFSLTGYHNTKLTQWVWLCQRIWYSLIPAHPSSSLSHISSSHSIASILH